MVTWVRCVLVVVLLVPGNMSSDPVTEGDDGYIDPFDMEHFQHPSNKKPVQHQQKINSDIEKSAEPDKKPAPQSTPPVSTVSPTTETKYCTEKSGEKPDSKSPSNILFRNYVKFLLGKFHGKLPQSSSTEEFLLLLKMSGEDVKNLERFASGQSTNVHDAHEILTSMLKRVTKSHYGTIEKMEAWFLDKFGFSMWDMIKILVMVALVCITMAAGVNIRLTWRQFVLKACILAFLISIPMTWYELFKAAEIQQQTAAMKNAPPECVRDKEDLDESTFDSWLGFAHSAFRGLFTFEKDNCQKYYEHMLISPFLKVPPTKALAVTFVRFFVTPLKDVGEALGEFLRALLIDLPITLYPIAIAAVTIFFFLFLFMWMGYSIRLPFFLSIEPGQTTVAAGDTGTQEAIEEHSRDLQNQIQTIQDALISQERRVMEKMIHIEKVQMASIEYSASVQQQSSGNNCPPTLAHRSKSPDPPQMFIEASKHDLEQSLSSASSAGGIMEHCPNIENIKLKSPIPCSEVTNSENWTQITTDDIVNDEEVMAVKRDSTPLVVDSVGVAGTDPAHTAI